MNSLSMTITIIRDYVVTTATCYLCFETLLEVVIIEIGVLTPVRHIIQLHLDCYEKLFLGMLQLARELEISEMH